MTTSGIDPRIQDRREEVERHQRRRRRLTLLLLVALTALVLGALGLARSPLLAVSGLEVVGADRTAIDEIVAASGIEVGMPMSQVDLGGARRGIATLPWVAEVRIVRQWPDRISIAVRERLPEVAVPAESGGWALVDASGTVVEHRSEVSARWLRIEGVAPAGAPGSEVAADVEDAMVAAAALPAPLRDGVDHLHLDEMGGLELRLVTGPRVRIGGIEDLDAKYAAAVTIFARVDPCGIDVVDVRVPDTPTVTRVPSCRLGAEEEHDDEPPGDPEGLAPGAEPPAPAGPPEQALGDGAGTG